MVVNRPQEIHSEFERAFNSGDVEALLALYEPQATFEAEPDGSSAVAMLSASR